MHRRHVFPSEKKKREKEINKKQKNKKLGEEK